MKNHPDHDIVTPPPPFWNSAQLTAEPGLVHCVTQSDSNMAITAGADTNGTLERRRQVCQTLALPFERLTLAKQVHGSLVEVVTGDLIGRGRSDPEDRISNVDALMTVEPDVPLMVLSADCCLMLVYDPIRPALAVAHAGWRGTAAGIARRVVQSMADSFGCQVETLKACLSPCAGRCCYEVGSDVAQAFDGRGYSTSDFLRRRNGKLYLDLAKANKLQLQSSGLRDECIDVADVCTICSDRYFSYRRDGRSTGQFALIAALRGRAIL